MDNSEATHGQDADTTHGQHPKAPTPLSEKILAILIVAMFPLLLVLTSLVEPVTLVHSGGAAPVTNEVQTGQGTAQHRYHTWDVSEHVESTFRPDGRVLGIGDDRLRGHLTVSVPDGCTDRTVRWRIAADGEHTARGTLKWLRKYELSTNYTLDHTPRKVTLSARWDGGSASCPSFHLIWDTPEARKDPD